MRLITGLALAALLLASACSNGGTGNNAGPDNAAATANAIPAEFYQPAPDLAEARALIGQIYQPYTRGQTPQTGRLYTPELSLAITRQSDADTGLGYDPFCRCQDFENFRYTIQSVEPRDVDGARAVVAFTNLGERHTITLLLDYRNDRWLVADIQEGGNSLLAGGRQR